MKKRIKNISVIIDFVDGWTRTKTFDNTQDAQSFLQTQRCHNKETRYQ